MKLKAFVLALLVISCSSPKEVAYGNGKITGNGKLITKEIKVSDYEAIQIGSGISCENIQGKHNKKKYPTFIYKQTSGKAQLEITVDENIYPLLKIENSHGELVISTKNKTDRVYPTHLVIEGNSKSLSKLTTSGCIDFISDKPLSGDKIEIKISGSSDVYLNKTTQYNELDIKVSGSGDLKAEDLKCRYVNAGVSGSGDVNMKGKADNANYRVSGSGDIKAFDLIVDDVECAVSGSGDIKAYARKNLNARASGSGDIRYKGDASVRKSTSGGGSIQRAN